MQAERDTNGCFVKGNVPWNRKSKVVIECEVCGKEFGVAPCRKDSAKFCGRECTGKAKSEFLKGNKFAEGRGPNQTSFKKGNVPWNKGMKYDDEMREKLDMSGLDPETGKETRFKDGQEPWNKGLEGYDPSPETHFKSEEISGSNSYNWKGGITSLTARVRGMNEYQGWRETVFRRDDYACQECGECRCYLEAHHKKHFADIWKENEIETIEQAKSCDELWDVDNGITLCEECHNNKHSNLK